MIIWKASLCTLILALVGFTTLPPVVRAQSRTQVMINDAEFTKAVVVPYRSR